MQSQLQSLLHKEVSRKEFLSVLGLAAISVFGMGHLLQLLTGKSLDKHMSPSDGYGASLYGGRKDQ